MRETCNPLLPNVVVFISLSELSVPNGLSIPGFRAHRLVVAPAGPALVPEAGLPCYPPVAAGRGHGTPSCFAVDGNIPGSGNAHRLSSEPD